MRLLFILAMPVFASRIDDCFAMRGDRSPEAIQTMTAWIEAADVRSCAVENLRIAEAVDPLRKALRSENPETRAAAARVLGTFRRDDLIGALESAAGDENLLVASNAMTGLMNYESPAVVPALERLALKGGMTGDMALDRIRVIAPSNALAAARHLLKSGSIPDQLYAMRALGELGDASDLAALRKIAGDKDDVLESRSRGFGFMPAISLSRAAATAIAGIERRTLLDDRRR
jgi:HEAT repeat protein